MDSFHGENITLNGTMLRSHDCRSKFIKPPTVHACAQSGDLPTFHDLLTKNPALLNEPNPIMAQTPLHLSAAYNNVEILNLLLHWRGSDMVKLEAQNMYGETPLHMAAKNGCTKATELLLAHGAFTEAKANNGMTPLHLAVWNPLQTDDSIVKTLLHHGADCSAKDNEGMTPLDHLNGLRSSKLRELLIGHLERQRICRAITACSETMAKMNELEVSISKIVGLKDLKSQLRKWAKGMVLDERRRALGLKVAARRPPHMAFIGNPGTGKTMVARILGRLLHMLGVLPTDKVTEVQRTDLVGEFVGHTGPKTRRKMKDAEGGILFVDEAYQLIPIHQKADDKDYGLEALEEIMSVMDSGKVVVIFAGYQDPMKRLISSNQGFYRRVTKFLYFEDLSCDDLAEMTRLKMNDQREESWMYGFKLDSCSCSADAISAMIRTETSESERRQRNGGLVDPMLVNARENLDLRLGLECADKDELVTITLEDLETGIRVLYGKTSQR